MIDDDDRLISFDGARLWFTAGDLAKTQVLLISGGPGCCDYLQPLGALLPAHCAAVRFDARGCGLSERRGPYDIRHTLGDLEALRAHLGIERWHVLGHSFGADIAIAYALQHPERTASALCVSGGRIVNDRQWHQAYASARDTVGELQPEQAFPYNLEVNERLNASWKHYCEAPDLLRRLADLARPVHFILADNDIRPNWPARQLAGVIQASTLQVISGAGHVIWGTHAEPLQNALRAALGPAADHART